MTDSSDFHVLIAPAEYRRIVSASLISCSSGSALPWTRSFEFPQGIHPCRRAIWSSRPRSVLRKARGSPRAFPGCGRPQDNNHWRRLRRKMSFRSHSWGKPPGKARISGICRRFQAHSCRPGKAGPCGREGRLLFDLRRSPVVLFIRTSRILCRSRDHIVFE